MIKSSKIFLISNESINKGFKVRIAGIDISKFLDNPVCMFNQQIIGEWSDVKIDVTKIFATPLFESWNDDAESVLDKIERGCISTAIIGLVPLRICGGWIEESELLEVAISPHSESANDSIRFLSPDGLELCSSEIEKLHLSIESPVRRDFRYWDLKDMQHLAFLSVNQPDVFKEIYGSKIEARNKYIESLELSSKKLALTIEKVDGNKPVINNNKTFLELLESDPLTLSQIEKNDPERFSLLYKEYVAGLKLSVSAFN